MQTKGFSLVELSIVLAILGLLTGGILAGQNLIRAAELRSVTTGFEQYRTAVNIFQEKYEDLPGDMSNAIDYWGAAHATPATCITTTGSGTLTCNGNGNGRLGEYIAGNHHENFHFWRQLVNAGLIEGDYTGVAGSGNSRHAVIGENAPKARLANSGFSVGYHDSFTSHTQRHLAESGNHQITFGGQSASNEVDAAILTPKEAWGIDTKIDDGLPASGRLVTFKGAGTYRPNCANAADTSYNLSDTAIRCSLNLVDPF